VNTALKLKAKKELTDSMGNPRRVDEEWLIRETGSYLPQAYEEVVQLVQGNILTDTTCLHLRALSNFTDVYGQPRQTGEEWLVKKEDATVHILDIYEELVDTENIQTLNSRQYCKILNPFDTEALKFVVSLTPTAAPAIGTHSLPKTELCSNRKPACKSTIFSRF